MSTVTDEDIAQLRLMSLLDEVQQLSRGIRQYQATVAENTAEMRRVADLLEAQQQSVVGQRDG